MPRILAALGVALLGLIPLVGLSNYHLHVLITILLWAFIYTGWSIMGRFGLVSGTTLASHPGSASPRRSRSPPRSRW